MIRRKNTAADVTVTFVLDQEEVPGGPVSVVGDFNSWTPGAHVLRKRSNGTRSVVVTVPAGTPVTFRYLAEDGRWFNDPDVEHREGADDVVVVQ